MRFAFGCFVVDSEQIILTKNGLTLECEPRVFELLVFFCRNPQEALSRELLVSHVWKGRVVSDAAVNRAVGELRKLLEDNPSSPHWIKTVSKIGYRLTVTPTVLEISNSNADLEKTQEELDNNCTSPSKENVALTQEQSPKLKAPRNPMWIMVVLSIFFIAIVFYFKANEIKSLNALKVVDRQPVTTSMGSAFNSFYSSNVDTLYYLYRSEKTPYAQVYSQKGRSSPHVLSNDDYYYTDVISDDDNNIYATRLNNLEQRECEIVKFNTFNKQFYKILNCGNRVVTPLEFDDKRGRLIYRFRPSISEPYALYSYQLDTGRKEQLTHPIQAGNNTGDYIFSIAKEHHILAVVEYDGNGSDRIKVIDLNDNKVLLNKPFINNVYGLTWLENNQLLASNSDGLYIYNTQTFKLENVEKSDQFSRLSHDQKTGRIFTERGQMTVNIFKYPMNGQYPQAITESSGVSQRPTFGNHSNLLAFISDRSGQFKIYIQEDDNAAIVAEFDEPIEYVAAMSWSPHDDKLVVSMNYGIYLYALNTKSWQKISGDFTKIHHVTFVKESIMFSAEIEGKWNIWQLSLANNEIKQITTKGGYSVKGNDKYILYTKFNREGLFQIDLITQEEKALIQTYPIAGWRHWQLHGETIFYLLNKEYLAFDLITGKKKVLHKFDSKMPSSCETNFNQDFFACEKVEVSTSNIWQFQLSQ
jgi:transcriptional activator of cad operon